jgi:uncharacterized protein YggE
MKRCLAPVFVATLLVAAPAAGAEVIQTVNTVSVVGIGRVLISPTASPTEADAVYHQALVQAVGDGLAKARLLSEATGAKVGPIEAISERGREFECHTSTGESARYGGSKPDSGTAEAPTLAVKPTVAPEPIRRPPAKPLAKKKKKAHKSSRHGFRRITARMAEATTAANCELSTEVSLIYDLEVP